MFPIEFLILITTISLPNVCISMLEHRKKLKNGLKNSEFENTRAEIRHGKFLKLTEYLLGDT